jgi:pseudouridine-5'-phosphate glycosidase
MAEYLIETALFTHGLTSISDQQIRQSWRLPEARFAWLEEGRIVIGTLSRYLPLRQQAAQVRRFDARGLVSAEERGLTGALTASATMVACSRLGIPLAVTCGMGGIGPRPGSNIGADLITLAELPVALIATAPKDVFGLPAP